MPKALQASLKALALGVNRMKQDTETHHRTHGVAARHAAKLDTKLDTKHTSKAIAPRRISAIWVQGLIDAMAQSGLDGDALCREVGLDMQALVSQKQGCPTEKLSQLWALAEARSGNPAIGLCASNTAKLASFELLGYVVMSSASLAEGLERLVRYVRILGDAQSVTLEHEGRNCRITLALFGGKIPVHPQRYVATLLTLLTFCRWVTATDLRPVAISLSQAPPMDLLPYQAAFACPIHFNAPLNSVLFSGADLAQRLPTANPAMATMVNQYASDQLKQLDHAEVSQKVRDLMVQKLPDGEPVRAEMAQLLSISERTLQRQLQREGTSFQQLLDSTRQELAERYLRQPLMSLAEVAYLLGFAEQSNFARAAKRWFKVSPGQYRVQLNSTRA